MGVWGKASAGSLMPSGIRGKDKQRVGGRKMTQSTLDK